MEKKLAQLSELGCDVYGALERFLNDKEMYLEFLNRTVDDAGLPRLLENIEQGDIEKAFDDAHMLKGVYGNMGLNPMYKLTSDIVESLREKTWDHVKENSIQLENQNEKLRQLLKVEA